MLLQVNAHGNSATADKLKTARNIKLEGAVSGNVSFDGSKDVIINTTQSNIAVLTGNVTLTNGTGSTNVNYPSGFTKSNCILISSGCQYNSAGWWLFGNGQGILSGARMTDSTVTFNVSTVENGVGPSGTYPFKIVLMKIS